MVKNKLLDMKNLTNKQKVIYKWLKDRPGYLKRSIKTIPINGTLKDKKIVFDSLKKKKLKFKLKKCIFTKEERKSIYNNLLRGLKHRSFFMCNESVHYREFEKKNITTCNIKLHLPELWKFRPYNGSGNKAGENDAWYNIEPESKELRIKHVTDALNLLNKSK